MCPAFLSLRPSRSPALAKHVHGAAVERAASLVCRHRGAAEVSELRIAGHRHGRNEAIGRELLAVHRLRRRLECGAYGRGSPRAAPLAITSATVLRERRGLGAALDRRVPQVQLAGEIAIARDATTLRARAAKRIEEVERDGDER